MNESIMEEDAVIKDAIEAGNQLINDLDNAFAEFKEENNFDFDSHSEECDDPSLLFSQLNLDNGAVDDSNDQDDMIKESDFDRACATNSVEKASMSSSESAISEDVHSKAADSRLSDVSNTEEQLEIELEQRVSEWIEKADSKEVCSDVDKMHDLEKESEVEVHESIEDEKKMNDVSPNRHSRGWNQFRSVPMSTIKAKPEFVSPLSFHKQEFGNVTDQDVNEQYGMARKLDLDQSTNEQCTDILDDDKNTHADSQSDLESTPQEKCFEDKGDDDIVDKEAKSKNIDTEEGSDIGNELDSEGWGFDDVDSLPSASDESHSQPDQGDCDNSPNTKSLDTLNNAEEDPSIMSTVDSIEPKHDPIVVATDSSISSNEKQKQMLQNNFSPNDVTTIESSAFFKATLQHEAESNAEDVLTLSLEIQKLQEQVALYQSEERRAQIQLKEEVKRREETEEELQRKNEEFEDVQHSYRNDIEKLMVECQQEKFKVQAAEVDAQEALDLAEDAATSRAEMEEMLEGTLDELEHLRQITQNIEKAQLPIITEDSSETNNDANHATPKYSPRRLDRRRVVVQAGRTLLRQRMDQDDVSFASTLDGSLGSNTTDNSYYLSMVKKSAEKRQRLVNRLKQVSDNESLSGKDVIVYSGDQKEEFDPTKKKSVLSKAMKSISSLIQSSGKSLSLQSRWFSRRNQEKFEEEDIEAMIRNYCVSVETIVSKQKEEIKELKSFCNYLEGKIIDE